jgi:hypothetical protein
VDLDCLPTDVTTASIFGGVSSDGVTAALLSGWCTLMLNDERTARMLLAEDDLALLARAQQQSGPLCSLFNKLRTRKEAGASNQMAMASCNTPLGKKGHVWLILSLVYQLIAYADNASIKSVAVELSQSFQMQDIVTNYIQLLSVSSGGSSVHGSPMKRPSIAGKNTRQINL